ncbi:hypothetical protein DXG01_009553 [Tephrocybe rancida]|nr:hypothetical protein DXG01_009553 [Tephrocybe rancida]
MANTDKEPIGLPQSSGEEEKSQGVESLSGGGEEMRDGKGSEGGPKTVVATDAEKTTSTISSIPKASTPSSGRPSLVQLGTSSTHHSATPPPKRFSAVNINKKFLEKNSSASTSSPISQPTSKTGGSSALTRPQTQSTASHSRLVTTKLTSTSPASSASGAGWSRPSSVAPQNATGTHSPNNSSPPLPTTSLTTTPSTTGAPQLPHAGKVIQPQPRAVSALPGLGHRDTIAPTKPVWGNLKSGATPKAPDVRNDFPTAAEVAQVASSLRAAKLNDSREHAETAAASKQARMEEADTFRGVHLDPNAHHWDEMEEDDDNFLDGVIEFGDGRQYKIDTNDVDSPLTPANVNVSRLDDVMPSKELVPDLPVSKEERFADDFDRSWPRSRTSPAHSRDIPLPSSHSTSHPPPASPATAQEMHAQQEAARVLFNERSNRLEPYSNGQRSGPGQYAPKKGSWHDSSSPTEPRSARDFPPTPQSPNIQLLQKAGDQQSRFRRFSGTSASGSGGFGPGPSNVHNRDRDQLPRRDGPPPSPRLSKDNIGTPGKDRDTQGERGRRSDMGPPPLPAHAMRGPSRDGGRQLPPHLSQIPANAPIRQESRPSRETRFEESHTRPVRLPSQSPVLSQASATRISPIVPLTPLPHLSTPEIDEARKDLMQSAAARAKQRRQQEEEEREREKERARRKAAELEERIKAAEAEKAAIQEKLEAEKVAKRPVNNSFSIAQDSGVAFVFTENNFQREEEAIAIIEDALKSVQPSHETADRLHSVTRRPPSLKGLPASNSIPLKSSSTHQPPVSGHLFTQIPASSPAVQADSWRTKATPLLPPPAPQTKPSAPAFVTPVHVESLVDGFEEDLEVVDFLDMGKFVGVPDGVGSQESGEDEGAPSAPVPPSRPVASDFFDDTICIEPPFSFTTTETPKISEASLPARDLVRSEISSNSSRPSNAESVPMAPLKAPPPTADLQTNAVLPQLNSARASRNQSHYKEAAMSALNDAMSRIKGALDGMQAGEGTKDSASPPLSELNNSALKNGQALQTGRSNAPKERWIPPALRPRNLDHESREVFHITCSEPPQSPKPAWGVFNVKLPSVTSLPLEPIGKKQLQAANKPSYQLRMDILSFDPPVRDMSRKDLSVNDVLFPKPVARHRANPWYRVCLPRVRPGPRSITAHPPSAKTTSAGTFGRPTAADGMTTWRKPVQTKQDDSPVDSGLTSTSPLDVPSTEVPFNLASEPPASAKSDGSTLARPRIPKMPAGSAVAFYRDSRIDAVEEDPHTSVNFIVGSELESRQASQVATPSNQLNVIPLPVPSIPSPNTMRNASKSQINGLKVTPESTPSLMPSKADSKSSDDSVSNRGHQLDLHVWTEAAFIKGDRVPVTPPTTHHTASWARSSLPMPVKESPARGPDPEHLRAVWSQTSNKAGIHGVNSLEGIADDLTALPFTLQDVKSEDGETPPPSVSAPPSRMSLHDVTRAFQQVPTSSSNSSPSHRTPPLSAPPARPSNYAYGLPPPPAGTIRPGYPYPPPIMSPSPGLMYPPMMPASPAPGRMPMNGHTPLYGQAMWMPMPTGSAPQSHTPMIRPMASPYPAHMIPYSPGPPMYGPQPHSVQQNGAQNNRDRTVPLMSPVLPPAGPAMYGSPVMMHAAIQPNHSYLIAPGRGQARADNGQIPQTSQLSSHSGYNPSTFRPTW